MLTIPVTILSAVYMCLLTIAYFSKDRISSVENKIYSNMIKLSFIGIILDAISCLLVIFDKAASLGFRTVTILIFMYYILWSGLFVTYTFAISLQKTNLSEQKFVKKYKKKLNGIILFFVFCALIVPLMPLNYYADNNVIFPEGLSVNFTYFIAGFLSITIMLLLMIINHKNVKSKKYIPVYSLIVLFLLTVVIQKLNPGLILTTTVECFITFIMYFTIENPDSKMIGELNRNKTIIEKTSQNASNFMFKLTTDARKYINDINSISNNALNNKSEYKETLEKVLARTKEAEMTVNSLIDISAIDIKNIKITNKEYNPNALFEEIRLKNQDKINNNIKFIVNISKNLPETLFGDKIRLKQVLTSLLNNAINHTEEGFISLDVSSIIKYDACRLIISIEDSGSGLPIDKVNDILSSSEKEIDLTEANTLDMDLNMVKKVMKLLGGSVLLSSEENKGTKVTIVLDQRISSNSNTNLEAKLASYNKTLGMQKVLIVDDNLNELGNIEIYLNEFNIQNVGTMYGKDAIDKIRTGQSFDLIILDDEMKPDNAINVLEELKKFENFNSKVVVMLKDKKLSLSKHYLNDGFTDIIDKSKLDVEIKRIVKDYLR